MMIPVLDLERPIEFYTGPFGMRLLRRQDLPEVRSLQPFRARARS
jgi:catechol 2,3-dioxygenase-like lactoylglutathione lyase family enzyme